MTPNYRITANSEDITRLIKKHLINIEYRDSTGIESDSLTITIEDDGSIVWPSKGAKLDFYLGFDRELHYKGQFIATEPECTWAPDQIIIHATASDMLSQAKAHKSINWSGAYIGTIVEQVAKNMGLIPVVSDKLRSMKWSNLYQMNESDLNFLTRLAMYNNAVAQVKGGRLLFVAKGGAVTASGAAMPTEIIDRSATSGGSYIEMGRNEYSRASAIWHQVTNEWVSGRQIPIRRYYLVYAGTGSDTYNVPGYFDSQDSAQRAANAALQGLDRAASKLSLDLSQGNPSLTAETALKLTGFRTRITELDWVIEQVTHNLDGGGGLSTSINAVRTSAIE